MDFEGVKRRLEHDKDRRQARMKRLEEEIKEIDEIANPTDAQRNQRAMLVAALVDLKAGIGRPKY